MSLHITEDLVLGARYRYTKTGATLIRMFDVGGLSPGVQTLAQAATAIDPASNIRIPRYGDPHPAAPGLYAIEIDAEPLNASRTAARVTVHYATPELSAVPGAVRIRIGGTSGHKLITQLPDGSLPIVKYTDPAGNVLEEHLQIPVLAANTLLEITRMETGSPLKLSSNFRRTANSSPWQGGAAKTWLCRGIDGTSQNGLTQYEVRYSFEYDPDGWERLEYFVDRYTGKVPDDVMISPNNDRGVAKLMPYGLRDFAALRLPNAF